MITSLAAAFAQAPDPRLSQLVEPGLGVQHDTDVLEGFGAEPVAPLATALPQGS
jgi:hypothetical protein